MVVLGRWAVSYEISHLPATEAGRGTTPRYRESASYERGTPLQSPLFTIRYLHILSDRDWNSIADQPAPAPHLAHPEGRAALRIVLVTVPRVSRSCEHFLDGFDLHLLRPPPTAHCTRVGVKGLGFGVFRGWSLPSLIGPH